MDISYQAHANRVVQMALSANYQQQLKNIQSSPKFNDGKALEFPGYTIITPLAEEDPFNVEINQSLAHLQEQLKQQLSSDLFVSVPANTFHITLADLIWDQGYRDALQKNSNFDQLFVEQMAEIFAQSQELLSEVESLDLEVVGISIFPRAIAVCFVPTEESYDLLIKLRQLIYQNPEIINLGIEQHYNFVGHVTLGYFGNVPEDLDVVTIATKITEINNQWLAQDLPLFKIKQWELRKFNDMLSYTRQPDWAQIRLS